MALCHRAPKAKTNNRTSKRPQPVSPVKARIQQQLLQRLGSHNRSYAPQTETAAHAKANQSMLNLVEMPVVPCVKARFQHFQHSRNKRVTTEPAIAQTGAIQSGATSFHTLGATSATVAITVTNSTTDQLSPAARAKGVHTTVSNIATARKSKYLNNFPIILNSKFLILNSKH